MANQDLPLGIKEEAWEDLDENKKAKLKLIANWDLSFLEGVPLFRQGVIRKEYHRPSIEELKKFLAIKVIESPKHMGMFGAMVVASWHAFILDTIKYEQFCNEVYGKTIHHVPGGKPVDDTTIWLSIYHAWFGKLPPVWKLDIGGTEMPGMETRMNVKLSCDEDHLDSDDGAYK